jgi:hypothetical protein
MLERVGYAGNFAQASPLRPVSLPEIAVPSVFLRDLCALCIEVFAEFLYVPLRLCVEV